MTRTFKAALRLTAVLGTAVALTGCATLSEKDPYESYNRTVYHFNDAVDRKVLKPTATAYKTVLPSFVQLGVSNFFGNLSDVWSSANNLMQGKGERGLSDITRVMINSTFGLGGLFDLASDAGLKRHSEDFGQTLGYWGVPPGPYVMLPLLGPSTLRDTVALPVDLAADPWGIGITGTEQAIGTVVRVVDQRAALLEATSLLDGAALDRYEFIRDGFLQRRKGQVFDGETSRKEAKEARKEDAAPDAKSIRAAYADEEDAGAPAAGADASKDASKDVTKGASKDATNGATKDANKGASKESKAPVSSETPAK